MYVYLRNVICETSNLLKYEIIKYILCKYVYSHVAPDFEYLSSV